MDDRNWLVHRAKRENRGALNDIALFNKLLARIDGIASDAGEINTFLATDMEDYVVRSGVDRSVIDVEATRLARSWGY